MLYALQITVIMTREDDRPWLRNKSGVFPARDPVINGLWTSDSLFYPDSIWDTQHTFKRSWWRCSCLDVLGLNQPVLHASWSPASRVLSFSAHFTHQFQEPRGSGDIPTPAHFRLLQGSMLSSFLLPGIHRNCAPHSSYSADSPSRKSSRRKLDGNHRFKQLRKWINRQKC